MNRSATPLKAARRPGRPRPGWPAAASRRATNPAAPLAAAFKETIPVEVGQPGSSAEPSDAVARGEWWTVFGDAQLNRLEAEAAQRQPVAAGGLAQAGARPCDRPRQRGRAPAADRHRRRRDPLAAVAGVARAGRRRRHRAAHAVARAGHGQLRGRPVRPRRQHVARRQRRCRSSPQALLALAAAGDPGRRGAALPRAALARRRAGVARADGGAARGRAGARRATLPGRRDQRARRRARTHRTVGDAGRGDRLGAGVAPRLEHALAVLVGKAPAELTLTRAPLVFEPVAIPAGLPSALLERRPDIAAAERAMAAANARIGVARAACFPRLTLTGALGFESGDLGDLLRWSSRTWALGPLAGTPAVDAAVRRRAQPGTGRRRPGAVRRGGGRLPAHACLSRCARSRTSWPDCASWPSRSREQSKSIARHSARRSCRPPATATASSTTSKLIDAERSVLATQRAATQVERERALATVGLIRALGGGWGGPPWSAASAATLGHSPAR